MLSHLDKKKIKLKLNSIYKSTNYKESIDFYSREIFEIIKKFNKKKK